MRALFCLFVALCWAAFGHAQTVLYQDDFEGAVTGWSNNMTDFDPGTTRILGRFDNSPMETSRTFVVPANTERVEIAFDFFRIDSWDNNNQFGFDRFEIDIDGSQIFSLQFSTTNTSRSGTSGNVDWDHVITTPRSQFAFNQAEPFWQEERHRVTIVVNNPGPTTEITLRANLSQGGNDEAAGYDNFLVQAFPLVNDIEAIAETFPPINGVSGGVTSSVLSSDTINGVVLSPADVTITSTQSDSPNVTLDPATGLITVDAGTPAAVYMVEYEICENIDPTNCSSVTETVTVFITGGGGGSCPVGTVAIPGTYNVVSASVTNGGQPNNLNGALGPPLPEGTTVTNENDSGTTFFQDLEYDLTGDPDIFVPAGTIIQVSFANHFNSNPSANISASLDGATSTALGTSSGPWVNNTFRYDDYVVPSGGARFLNIDYQGGGGLRFDGVIYDTQCQPFSEPAALEGSKTVAVFDPLGDGLFALPGNDVIYTITVTNPGPGEVDSESLFLVDRLPGEVVFFNGDVDGPGPELDPLAFQGAGSGLTFDFATDASFSDGLSVPSSLSDCTYLPVAGYDPNVRFVCISPTGTMQSGTSWQVSFRARIQ